MLTETSDFGYLETRLPAAADAAAPPRRGEYAAPPERILHEARYFEVVAPRDADGVCPVALHLDPAHLARVLEDLGRVEQLDAALRRGDATPGLRRVARFLGAVHGATRGSDRLGDFPDAARVGVLRRTISAARVPEVSDDAVALGAIRLGRELALGERRLA